MTLLAITVLGHDRPGIIAETGEQVRLEANAFEAEPCSMRSTTATA